MPSSFGTRCTIAPLLDGSDFDGLLREPTDTRQCSAVQFSPEEQSFTVFSATLRNPDWRAQRRRAGLRLP